MVYRRFGKSLGLSETPSRQSDPGEASAGRNDRSEGITRVSRRTTIWLPHHDWAIGFGHRKARLPIHPGDKKDE